MKTKSKIILSIFLSLAVVFTSFCIGIGCRLSPTRVASAYIKPHYNFNVNCRPYLGFTSEYLYDTSWTAKTWSGLSSFTSQQIWSDGTTIYFSSGNDHYYLDTSTSTWVSMSWNGYRNVRGLYIWSDGVNIYYSNSGNQYVLDVATSSWNTKTWTGLSSFYGSYIWTDGTNIYCSAGAGHYVLDVATSTWSVKTWTGLTNFIGAFVWTDGTNIYYTYNSVSYVLDISTSTWSIFTWNGNIVPYDGRYIWSDGTNVYYSYYSGNQYILDTSTSTWSAFLWGNFRDIEAEYVWTDGVNIYYSESGVGQYVLDSHVAPPPPTPVSPYSGLLADAMYAFGAGLTGMYNMLGGVIESTFGDLFVETIDGTQFLSAFGNIVFIVLGIILAIHVARFVIHYFIKRSERC